MIQLIVACLMTQLPIGTGQPEIRPTSVHSEGGNLVFRDLPGEPVFLWATAGDIEYANCDGSTTPPVLNVNDFTCFANKFAAGDPWANCDGSTLPPVLNVLDFNCFLNAFATGTSNLARWDAGVPTTPPNITTSPASWRVDGLPQMATVVIGRTGTPPLCGNWYGDGPVIPGGSWVNPATGQIEPMPPDPMFHPRKFHLCVWPVGGVVSLNFGGWVLLDTTWQSQNPDGSWSREYHRSMTVHGSASIAPTMPPEPGMADAVRSLAARAAIPSPVKPGRTKPDDTYRPSQDRKRR